LGRGLVIWFSALWRSRSSSTYNSFMRFLS
jgi:hypothetical protein